MASETSKELSKLTNPFHNVVQDLRNVAPLWEELAGKAAKMQRVFEAASSGMLSFFESLQKVADAASSSKGSIRDFGVCLTKITLRHRNLAQGYGNVASAFGEDFAKMLSQKMDERRKALNQLERDHERDFKHWKSDLKKVNLTAIKLNKEVKKKKKGGSTQDASEKLEKSLESAVEQYEEFEAYEQLSLRQVLLEERRHFSALLQAIKPFVEAEVSLLDEAFHLQGIQEEADKLIANAGTLPKTGLDIANSLQLELPEHLFQSASPKSAALAEMRKHANDRLKNRTSMLSIPVVSSECQSMDSVSLTDSLDQHSGSGAISVSLGSPSSSTVRLEPEGSSGSRQTPEQEPTYADIGLQERTSAHDTPAPGSLQLVPSASGSANLRQILPANAQSPVSHAPPITVSQIRASPQIPIAHTPPPLRANPPVVISPSTVAKPPTQTPPISQTPPHGRPNSSGTPPPATRAKPSAQTPASHSPSPARSDASSVASLSKAVVAGVNLRQTPSPAAGSQSPASKPRPVSSGTTTSTGDTDLYTTVEADDDWPDLPDDLPLPPPPDDLGEFVPSPAPPVMASTPKPVSYTDVKRPASMEVKRSPPATRPKPTKQDSATSMQYDYVEVPASSSPAPVSGSEYAAPRDSPSVVRRNTFSTPAPAFKSVCQYEDQPAPAPQPSKQSPPISRPSYAMVNKPTSAMVSDLRRRTGSFGSAVEQMAQPSKVQSPLVGSRSPAMQSRLPPATQNRVRSATDGGRTLSMDV